MTAGRAAAGDAGAGGIPPLVLSRGQHAGRSRGTCLMEATALLAGEPQSDRPACVHPVLAALARVVNDAVADDVRSALLPLSLRLIGTADAAPAVTEQLVALCCRRAQAVTPPIWTVRLRRDLRRIEGGRAISLRRAVGTATCAAASIALACPPRRDRLLVDLLTDAIGLADEIGRADTIGPAAEWPAVGNTQGGATAQAGPGRAQELSLGG